MHDVTYTIAFYTALVAAILLSIVSLGRALELRLPPPVGRWLEPRGALDRLVRALALFALVILLLWLVRAVD
jgi:hypothetical protein